MNLNQGLVSGKQGLMDTIQEMINGSHGLMSGSQEIMDGDHGLLNENSGFVNKNGGFINRKGELFGGGDGFQRFLNLKRKDNDTQTLQEFVDELDLPDNAKTTFIIMLILQIGCSGPVALMGVISNTINIIVFKKQGITENSPTLTLTFLAIADLMGSFFNTCGAVFGGINYFINLQTIGIFTEGVRAFLITRPQSFFSQITCCVTAYLSIERMISVTMPFKVKTLFTVKNSMVILVSIYIINLITNAPLLFEGKPIIFEDFFKQTSFRYSRWGMPYKLVETAFLLNSSIIFLTLGVVIVCNAIVFWKVKISQRFRSTASGIRKVHHEGNQSDTKESSKNAKEARMLKMITAISSVFLLTYIWYIPYSILIRFIDYKIHIKFHLFEADMYLTAVTFLQVLNGSVNFIIYYKMSSRFRDVVNELFGKVNK